MTDLPSLYVRLMERLEIHARKLLEKQFDVGEDLWRIQQDLLKFQIELQEAIASEQTSRKKIRAQIAEVAKAKLGAWKKDLQDLQVQLSQTEEAIQIYKWVHRISKRLGDAWAWCYLQLDEHKIEPLTRNQRVPSTTSGYALKGVLAIAEALSNAGAGFPIIHDMTDCLRIGDITFVSPNQDPLTVEVKTHLLRADGNLRELGVTVHAVMEPARWQDLNIRIEMNTQDQRDKATMDSNLDLLKVDAQLDRQLQRMRDAKAWQSTIATDFVYLGTRKGISVQPTFTGTTHHWDVMCDVVKQAKTKGFASQSVDGALVYIALYSDEPLIWPGRELNQTSFADSVGKKIVKAIATSDIWFPDDRGQNSLWYDASWSDFTDRRYVHILPLLLWPLDPELVIDMMWGRLWVIVGGNLGKIAAALRNVGLDARIPKDKADLDHHFLGVSGTRTLDDGRQFYFRLHQMQYYATRMLHDCLSLDAFVHMLHELAQAGLGLVIAKEDSPANESGKG